MEEKVPTYEKKTLLCLAEVNPEEGAGDNGPEGPGGEEPAVQMVENQL
jgi:hypothetical protein